MFKFIYLGGVIIGSLAFSILLITNHYGFAIKIAAYFFYMLLAILILKSLYEK